MFLTLFYAGGMLKGSCILILCQRMNIFLYGMKILDWNTSTETSIFLFPSVLSCSYLSLYAAFSFFNCILFTRYINMVKKHGLEISQPGLEPNSGLTWEMTKRRDDTEVHKYSFLSNFNHFSLISCPSSCLQMCS